MGTCRKKRFKRKIDVKMILAFKSDRRGERRYYWHSECKAYHLTSQERRDAGTGNNRVEPRDN